VTKANIPKPRSIGEEAFALHIRAEKLPPVEREYMFHGERKWRLDFAWPDQRIAVEIEGGLHSGGRHTRAKGYQEDITKYNEAVAAHWAVFRFSTSDVMSGRAIEFIKRVFE